MNYKQRQSVETRGTLGGAKFTLLDVLYIVNGCRCELCVLVIETDGGGERKRETAHRQERSDVMNIMSGRRR